MTTINTGDLVTASQINQWAPPGAICDFAGSVAPSGWLICDGSAISRTTYAALFAAIGTLHGNGDGSTTFNIPDCRGRAAVGLAPSGGHADVSTLGANDGVAVANRRPKHRHTPHNHTTYASNAGAAGGSGTGSPPNVPAMSGPSGSFQSGSTSSNDGGTSNGNDPLDAPAYIVLNKIIRARDI